MKLDPGMHIVMHLIFFGKTGVTSAVRARAQLVRHGCRRCAVEHWGASPRTAPHPHASGPPEQLCRRTAPRAPPPEHDRATTSSTAVAGQGRPEDPTPARVAPAPSPRRRAPGGQRDLRRSTRRRSRGRRGALARLHLHLPRGGV
jgi:hypothetical protein